MQSQQPTYNYSSQPGQLLFPHQRQQQPGFQPLSYNTANVQQEELVKEEDFDLDDDYDDDLNIDTSNMTQAEKNAIKYQRKLRKMNREKLKRAKLNNQFQYLSQMLSMGRTNRVEKLTVLNEAIRTVCQLQAENDGLRFQKTRIQEELDRRSGSQTAPSTHPKMQYAQMQMSHLSMQPMQHDQPMKKEYETLAQQFNMQTSWQQPQDNDDLEFAFGSSEDFWQAGDEEQEPWHQQWPVHNALDMQAFPKLAAFEEDDSVDMFLAPDANDANDLLCFAD